MSIRVILCFAFVIGFSIYAWRDWFKSLCAAIVMMAVLQHPDMPKTIIGIQGLNPWNILMANIMFAWWFDRARNGVYWDMPRYVRNLYTLFFVVVFSGYVRLIIDPGELDDYSFMSATSEYLINSVKWVVPGLLLFDGCRTRLRVTIALTAILAVYFLLSLQVIRRMPLGAVTSGDKLSYRASKIIQNEIGYNRVTLSMMLAGASWATLATLILIKKFRYKLLILGCAGIVLMGQALTGGRTGYLAWAAVGLILCCVRWRRFLPLIPLAALMVVTLVPSVRERVLHGFGEDAEEETDAAGGEFQTVTSGRSLIWPHVLKEIGKSPLVGYGKSAMVRIGLSRWLSKELNEEFGHPHNAYLEVLLDNGVIGFLIVVPFFFVILRHSFSLFLDREDVLCCAVGGVACALVLALMTGAMGGQTFYPREGSVGMWATIGLMFRLSVERARFFATGEPMFGENDEDGETEYVGEDEENEEDPPFAHA